MHASPYILDAIVNENEAIWKVSIYLQYFAFLYAFTLLIESRSYNYIVFIRSENKWAVFYM